MKGIYLSQDLSHAKGIQKKILRQIEEFKKNGYEMTDHINCRRTKFHLLLNVIPFISRQYFKTNNIKWEEYDFVYLRKPAIFDASVIRLLKNIKKNNPDIIIVLEIPTFPYVDEFNGLLKYDVLLKESIWTRLLKKYVDKIITYSDDKSIFGIPCINISNAYDFESVPSVNESIQQEIHLLAVATLCFYHGYDRVIEGLRNYYKKNPKIIIKFTLVGDGPVLKQYKTLIKEYNLDSVVSLVGKKDINELGNYYRNADIGVDSLGRYRSNIYYNSSLKGKEYLANGLPIISGVKTDLDGEDLPFYYRVSNDSEPIDFFEVVEWYQKLVLNSSKKELSEKIYHYGKEKFSFSKTFEPVIQYIGGE